MEYIDSKQAVELVAGADRLPRAEIDQLARERLRFLVSYAREHSPYLKQKYANLPKNFDLTDIPVSTRTEMVEQFDRWVCDPDITAAAVADYVSEFENIFTPFLRKYAVVSTSGTTAAPLRIVRDSRHLAIHGALMSQRYFHGPLLRDVPGIDDPDLKNCGIIPAGGYHSSYISFLKMQRSYAQRGLQDRTKLIPLMSSTETMVAELNAFQPDMIGCYPSVIYSLAHEQAAGRLHISPRFIGCSAEKLTEEQRRYIVQVFGCPVNDNYCSTEGGEVAMLCPNGHLHINSDWVIVEPVDREGNPVPAGVQSDGILITNLACLVQPVIRYRMSDQVTLYDTPCGCGLHTPYLEIAGREDDLLVFSLEDRTVRVSSPQLIISAVHTEGCDVCQFIQRSDTALELRVVTMQGYDRQAVIDRLVGTVTELFATLGLGHVRLIPVDAPPVRTKGGKLRLVYQDFQEP